MTLAAEWRREEMREKLRNYYEAYCESIREEAERLRPKQMPQPTEELFAIFENTGNRLTYEAVYFQRRKFLAIFGLKTILDGEEQDIAKLEEVLEEICGEECWALPAHVNREKDRDWRIYVDLFAAETGQTLAEILSLLEGKISERVAGMIRREVRRRVLDPFCRSKAPYGIWEYNRSNWCAVCGGSVGSAAIYLMQEEPERLGTVLKRICYSLQQYYLEGFAEDGTCLEGLGYFTYGMTYFAGFAEQLYRFTEGKADLFQGEKLARIAAFQAKCYFDSGRTVSFADGFCADTLRPGLTCYLAMRYPEAGIPPMECAAGINDDTCYRWMGLYRNLIWTRRYLELWGAESVPDAAAYPKMGICVLPDAQWVICHSRNGAGMAAKGGNNGEPHNHNDVGSFFYLNGEDVLLTDLGCGEYTGDYFSDRRYGYLCCRSLGHNVPLVDGGEQLSGEAYGCDLFEAGEEGRIVIGFAGAYGNPALQSLTRRLDWNQEDGTLQVEDVFTLSRELQSLRENLVTVWKPEIQDNEIRIQGEKKGCLITIQGKPAEIACIRQDFSDHDGIRRDVWLLQWEVYLPGESGTGSACFSVKAL